MLDRLIVFLLNLGDVVKMNVSGLTRLTTARPQPFCLCMENVADQIFLVVGLQIYEFGGNSKLQSIGLRDGTNDFDQRLDEPERRKNHLDRELVTGGELPKGDEPHASPAQIDIRRSRHRDTCRMSHCQRIEDDFKYVVDFHDPGEHR